MQYVKRHVFGTTKQSYRSHPTAQAFVVNTNRNPAAVRCGSVKLESFSANAERAGREERFVDSGTMRAAVFARCNEPCTDGRQEPALGRTYDRPDVYGERRDSERPKGSNLSAWHKVLRLFGRRLCLPIRLLGCGGYSNQKQ